MLDLTKQLAMTIMKEFPDIAIYTEPMQNGKFVEPSIFIERVSMTVSPILANGKKQEYSFDVSYFPSPDVQVNKDLDIMAEKLTNKLITIDDESGQKLARLVNRDLTVVDQVLHFTFSITIYSHELIDKLDQTLEINTEIKQGE